jgi:hypothetical protein
MLSLRRRSRARPLLVGRIFVEYNQCRIEFRETSQAATGDTTMRTRVAIVGGLLLMLATAAESQVVVRPRGAVAAYGGWGGWGGGYTGTTPQESWARGMSDVIRAQGDAYEAAARGAISYEQARTAYMDNQLRWHQISLERQRMGEQQRAEKAAADRATRERRQASAVTKPPELLSDGQYDRSTGTAYWPELLATETFADQRAKLDAALKTKAHTGENAQLNQQIIDLSNDMLSRLKASVRDVPPATYMESRKFLDQLSKEAKMGLG